MCHCLLMLMNANFLFFWLTLFCDTAALISYNNFLTQCSVAIAFFGTKHCVM